MAMKPTPKKKPISNITQGEGPESPSTADQEDGYWTNGGAGGGRVWVPNSIYDMEDEEDESPLQPANLTYAQSKGLFLPGWDIEKDEAGRGIYFAPRRDPDVEFRNVFEMLSDARCYDRVMRGLTTPVTSGGIDLKVLEPDEFDGGGDRNGNSNSNSNR